MSYKWDVRTVEYSSALNNEENPDTGYGMDKPGVYHAKGNKAVTETAKFTGRKCNRTVVPGHRGEVNEERVFNGDSSVLQDEKSFGDGDGYTAM